MEEPRCAAHPWEPAAGACEACGVSCCARCLSPRGGRLLCPSCVEGDGPEAPRGLGEKEARAASPTPAAGAAVWCAFHPGARAAARCSRCGAFICAACRRGRGGASYCDLCFRQSTEHARQGGRAGRTAASSRLAGAAWKMWPGLAFLPVPFLLSGFMTYMMRQGEAVSVGAAQLFISLLLYSTILTFTFLAVSRYGNALERLGMHGNDLAVPLALGAACGSLAFLLGTASGLMSTALLERMSRVEEWLRGFFDVNVKTAGGADMVVAGLIIVIAAPLCEEIFFRGFLYPAMRRRLGIWSASLLNGFLFAAVHFSLYGLLGRTLSGTLFCLLYEYTGNLWSPVAAHGINNFLAFFVPLSGIW